MLCGSCASAIGAIEGVFKPAMLIIAAANAKIVGLIPIFSLILIVGLIAVAALIFTPRKIAGIWFCPLPQDAISVLRVAPNLAPVPH
jgi:hypothetical protein